MTLVIVVFNVFFIFKCFSDCCMSKIYHINNKSKPSLVEQGIKFHAKSRSIIIENFIDAMQNANVI